MARFAKIGVGAGKTFDADALSPEMRKAIEEGMADAWTTFEESRKRSSIPGRVTTGDVFGTREYLKNNYLYRMAGAVLGIYGNSKEEAMYPVYFVDADGQKLDGANRYTLRFAPGQLPPVNAFWSLTMYELPASLLVANPLNRYLINSPMLPNLKRDADGGLTLYVQNDRRARTRNPTGCPRPRVRSSRCCASTGRSRRRSTDSGSAAATVHRSCDEGDRVARPHVGTDAASAPSPCHARQLRSRRDRHVLRQHGQGAAASASSSTAASRRRSTSRPSSASTATRSTPRRCSTSMRAR